MRQKIDDFFNSITKYKVPVIDSAYMETEYEIKVFAIINPGDGSTENKLFTLEEMLNEKHKGKPITLTVEEKADGVSIPVGYKKFVKTRFEFKMKFPDIGEKEDDDPFSFLK